MIHPTKPIIGYSFAAPYGGKDTVQKEIVKIRPEIGIIHTSQLLKPIIKSNPEYQRMVAAGELLPPQEAVKAFRRGFLEITLGLSEEELPHLFCNGPCRDDTETRNVMSLVRRVRGVSYQPVGFYFQLSSEVVAERAEKRVQEAIARGENPRLDDLGNTPVRRYQIFCSKINPVLKQFRSHGGFVVEIDANKKPELVTAQILEVYSRVSLPACA